MSETDDMPTERGVSPMYEIVLLQDQLNQFQEAQLQWFRNMCLDDDELKMEMRDE